MNPRDLLDRIRTAFDNLSMRERFFVLGAGASLIIALFYVGLVVPALAASDDAEQRVYNAEQQLEVMRRLRRDYDDVVHRLASVEARIDEGARGNLRTALENLAKQVDVKIEAMEPQASPDNDQFRETKVAVRLQSVTLEQAVKLLHQIETHPRQVLSVKKLRLQNRSDESQRLNLSFTVSSFEAI